MLAALPLLPYFLIFVMGCSVEWLGVSIFSVMKAMLLKLCILVLDFMLRNNILYFKCGSCHMYSTFEVNRQFLAANVFTQPKG